MARVLATLTLALLNTASVVSQAPASNGCPKLNHTGPSLVKPANCPDWRTGPAVQGTLKDNECLIGGIVGGDFFNPCYAPDLLSSLPDLAAGASKSVQDWSGGSGPFKAQFFTDASLPLHAIYAPKEVATDRKLPLLAWANGVCATDGSQFSNFLTEIASHGFMVIANGAPSKQWGGGKAASGPGASLLSGNADHSRAVQLTQAIDWAEKGAAAGKYGAVDMGKIGVAGQSCGGVEAYSASVLDPRVKAVGIYNTGVIDPGRRHYLKQLKQPLGLFYGGDSDFSKDYIEQDFKDILPTLPAIKAILPKSGHGGTYSEKSGGKYGNMSVAYWKWQLNNDQAAKALFFEKASTLHTDGWEIDTSHWAGEKNSLN